MSVKGHGACSGPVHIGAPALRKGTDGMRLVASVQLGEKPRELWFEFAPEYESWAVPERSDAFVLMLLEYALWSGRDLVCEAPVTDRLLCQLNDILMPQMAAFAKEFGPAHVIADPAAEIPPIANGVGTGLSCGVDSFYTVYRHLNSGYAQLTHLFFNNVGALTKDPSRAEEIFEQKRARFAGVAAELGLPLVAVNTNMLEVLWGCPDGVTQPGTFKNAACLFALKRGFVAYWMSSGWEAGEFRYDFEDNDTFLPMSTQALTLRDFLMLPDGLETPRIERVRAISAKDVVRRHLSVCAGENCGRCAKCTRTQFELYALGVLDDFDEVFDVGWFKRHLVGRLAFSMADLHERSIGFVAESLGEARRNGIRIPLSSHLVAWCYFRPLLFIKRHLADSALAHRIYDRLGLRRRLGLGE